MLSTTQDAVRALLKADPSLSPSDRSRIVATLRNHGRPEVETTAAPPRILRRIEAARRLGITLRTVDQWTRQGILVKIRLPGRTRAAGFREADVAALITAR